MFRRSALALGALLGAFHVWLLGHQAWTGQLSDPGTIGRWVLGAALIGGLVALRRRGLPLLFGRQAVAMWLLAAVLHGPALANDFDGFATPVSTEAVATVAQAAATIAAVGLTLLAVAGLLGAVAAPLAGLALAEGSRVAPASPVGWSLRFLPRPPPLA